MIEKIYIKKVCVSSERAYATVVIDGKEIEYVKVKRVFLNELEI